jgi:arylsulfatase A-like enzyme
MDPKPNILFILADDLGVADLSCYGHPTIRTPHLDSLAEQGVRFTQAYANSAVCSATRVALMTGRYQYRLPVGLEEPLATRGGRASPPGLPPGHPTLPSLLKAAGYATDLIGKWHLGAPPHYSPEASGYDTFWGFRSGTIDYYTHKNPAGRRDFWDGDEAVVTEGYSTDLFGDRAVETVRRRADEGRPFFISLHLNAPHWPWLAPGDEAEARRIEGSNLLHLDGGTLETYRLIVERMDHQIGRVLQALADADAAENTIVVFTSDNGGERFSNTWPFTGKKTELLEGGLRVPSLVRWTAGLPAGRDCDQPGMTMDWLPTLLSAPGLAPDPEHPSDGADLLPWMRGERPPEHRALFWRYKANHQRAVRIGDFKALKLLGNSFLFNVVKDPLERANLKDRMPEVFARLTQAWTDWNASMLAETAESYTHGFDGSQLADHFGLGLASQEPGDQIPWP